MKHKNSILTKYWPTPSGLFFTCNKHFCVFCSYDTHYSLQY